MRVLPESWSLVVPVRRPETAKSRLGLGREVAESIARCTLEAASAATLVGRLVLVTDSAQWTGGIDADVVVERCAGLSAAVRAGLRASGEERVAVMVGDLPVLQPADLMAALAEAVRVDRGMVSDRHGTGTVLITALKKSAHCPSFGIGSAVAHRSAGYVELAIPATSSLRMDVDTVADLRDAFARGAPSKLSDALVMVATGAAQGVECPVR